MELPLPSLATVEAVWGWSKKNMGIWFQILRNPSSVLSAIDFKSTDSTIAAIQFAIFPISLSIIIEYQIYILANDTTLGFGGYIVAKIVAYFAFVFIYALAQQYSAKIFLRRGEFNACIIATLYAAAFWPIVVLTNYAVATNDMWPFLKIHLEISEISELLNHITKKQSLELFASTLITITVWIYLLGKFVPMAAITHGTSRSRAFLICLGTIAIGTPLTALFMQPFSKIFYGYDLF
jgi:hypothetical protein